MHWIYMLSLYSPFIFLLFLSCFLAGRERCVFTGGGWRGRHPPSYTGQLAGGSWRLVSLPTGSAAIHFVLYCKTDVIYSVQLQTSLYMYVLLLQLFALDNMFSQDRCNKLIKGVSFYIFMTHVCSARPLSARHVSGIVLHVVTFSLMCHAWHARFTATVILSHFLSTCGNTLTCIVIAIVMMSYLLSRYGNTLTCKFYCNCHDVISSL